MKYIALIIALCFTAGCAAKQQTHLQPGDIVFKGKATQLKDPTGKIFYGVVDPGGTVVLTKEIPPQPQENRLMVVDSVRELLK